MLPVQVQRPTRLDQVRGVPGFPRVVPSGPEARISRIRTTLRMVAIRARKVAARSFAAPGGIEVPGDRVDTYRLSYQCWQPVWDVGFRIICEDEDMKVAKQVGNSSR
ncbi:MAG: hypothetical protein CMP31_11960 [Roseibacillus sp.]|nr:hypothetical protein [Roseibacillus sp.]